MNIREYRPKIFSIFSTQWGLVTAGTIEDFNTMTIAWGAMGTVWGTVNEHARDTITVYVNPLRHTFGYMNENDHFSVNFFPEDYRKDLGILGSKSGRDGDKVALTKLTPKAVEHGVIFEQAEINFICKKLYWQDMVMENMADVVVEQYKTVGMPPHRMYIGQGGDVIENS